jgi:hypothetical protein
MGLKTSLISCPVKLIPDYIYRLTDIVTYDEEAAFAIEFEQRENVDLPLFKGTVYINTVDYGILNAEFEINPKLIHLMKNSFISTSHHMDLTHGRLSKVFGKLPENE